MGFFVRIDDGPVAGEFQFRRDCGLAFDLDLFVNGAEGFPVALVFVLLRVCRVQQVHV
jgi:hypothetical protein